MGTPHKHRDVIIAWANGEEIQWKPNLEDEWIDLLTDDPSFHEYFEFRIKPKRVKKEGWVNVYKGGHRPDYFSSYEEAVAYNPFNKQEIRITTIRIEWEEED